MVLSYICKHHNPVCHGHCCESAFIFYTPHSPMLLHDMKVKKLPFEVTNLVRVWQKGKPRMSWKFKCRNYNKETGLCNDYPNRPKHPCKTFICNETVDIIALCYEPIEDLPW